MKISSIHLMQAFNKCEYIFAFISCLFLTGAVIPLLIIQGASEGDGIDLNSFDYRPQNFILVLIYLASSCLLFLRWRMTFFYAIQSPSLLALTLVVPLSFIWSKMPDETLIGSIGVIGTTFFGIYFGSRFTLQEQLKLLAWACGIVALLSVIFMILLPKYGIMGGVHAGIPRGVFTHKNAMGKFMVFSTTIFLIMVKGVETKKILYWSGLILSMSLVILSQSTSSLLNTIMLTGFVLSAQIFRWKPTALIPAFFLVVATSVVFQSVAATVLGYFGKDLTLTGRTEIWPLVIEKIQERPLLGYGFNGFWNGLAGDSAYIIRALRWSVPNSHNGFLDLVLSLGLLGLSLFFITYWINLLKSISILVKDHSTVNLWPIVLMTYLVIINFSETDLLTQGSFVWMLFVASSISVSAQFKRLFLAS